MKTTQYQEHYNIYSPVVKRLARRLLCYKLAYDMPQEIIMYRDVKGAWQLEVRKPGMTVTGHYAIVDTRNIDNQFEERILTYLEVLTAPSLQDA